MGVFSCTFDEFDASEVFPVAHSLLEKCLVCSGEIGVYFVGDDSEIPDALLTGRGRSPVADQGGGFLAAVLSDPSFSLVSFDLGCLG